MIIHSRKHNYKCYFCQYNPTRSCTLHLYEWKDACKETELIFSNKKLFDICFPTCTLSLFCVKDYINSFSPISNKKHEMNDLTVWGVEIGSRHNDKSINWRKLKKTEENYVFLLFFSVLQSTPDSIIFNKSMTSERITPRWADVIMIVKHLPDSSVLASVEWVTPLSPSPLAAVWPVPASVDGWTLSPPSGSTN